MDEIRSWVENSPYSRFLGVKLERVDAAGARLVLPYSDENSNPGKALHGGCAASIGAIGGQVVARAVLGADAGPCHTAQMQVSYLAAAIGEDVVAEIGALEGVSGRGGEPFDQGPALVELLTCLRRRLPTLGLIVFSGYSYASLTARAELSRLWPVLDTLVDGPFDAKQREAPIGGRRYIGSTNQELVHLSPRYRDPELWRGPAQAEVQVDRRGRLSVHGEPELTRRLRLALVRPN